MVAEVVLYDNSQRFKEPYILTVFAEPLWKSGLRSMATMLVLSVMLLLLILVVFYLGIKAWRKEKEFADLRKDMMHNLSHEMNTPISNMGLAIQSLRKQHLLAASEKTEAYFKILEQENKHLAENVVQMLDYAQMDETQLSIEMKSVDLSEVIKKILENFKETVSFINGHLEYELPDNPLVILGDESQLINVFYNLVDNALRYGPENNQIVVKGEFQKSKIIISVEDNNPSIPSRHKSKIFQKYYHRTSNSISKVKGYGLGLYYAKKVVNQHYGKIWLDTSYKEGNRFLVLFPVNE